MPNFPLAPAISAVANGGAAEYARGIQMCKPAKPAFAPKPMTRKSMSAPLSRAVPLARWPEESSVMAVVSVSPGMSTIRPAGVPP